MLVVSVTVVRADTAQGTASRLSKTLREILHDRDALPHFIQFMETRGAGHLVRFWLDVESFHASTATRLQMVNRHRGKHKLEEEGDINQTPGIEPCAGNVSTMPKFRDSTVDNSSSASTVDSGHPPSQVPQVVIDSDAINGKNATTAGCHCTGYNGTQGTHTITTGQVHPDVASETHSSMDTVHLPHAATSCSGHCTHSAATPCSATAGVVHEHSRTSSASNTGTGPTEHAHKDKMAAVEGDRCSGAVAASSMGSDITDSRDAGGLHGNFPGTSGDDKTVSGNEPSAWEKIQKSKFVYAELNIPEKIQN